jgi:hypothetical protein
MPSLFGQRAVAQLTAAMLMRGTRDLDRRQLADEFTRLKINGNVYRFETTRENLARHWRWWARCCAIRAWTRRIRATEE